MNLERRRHNTLVAGYTIMTGPDIPAEASSMAIESLTSKAETERGSDGNERSIGSHGTNRCE